MSCTQASYTGPDTNVASVVGTCRDRAGWTSAPFTHTFRYDATAPVLAGLGFVPGDRLVRLQWAKPPWPVQITRSPGVSRAPATILYRGRGRLFQDLRVKNGIDYQYTFTITDEAGNASTSVLDVTPARRILEPTPGARVAGPPLVVRWSPIRNADYYNVQLYRGARKILSTWPKASEFTVRATWKYLGNRYRLKKGGYKVYVWPGFGTQARQRYGHIVGTTKFVVQG